MEIASSSLDLRRRYFYVYVHLDLEGGLGVCGLGWICGNRGEMGPVGKVLRACQSNSDGWREDEEEGGAI